MLTKVAEGAIPGGARLVSTAISEGRIALAYEYPGGTALIMVDPETLEIVGRLDLKP